MVRLVSLVCTHESESHRASASQFLSVVSHFGERDRVTGLKRCLAPQRRHMSSIFWGLVSSQKVLMELCFGICTCRLCCSRDGECQGGKRGETSLSVKLLKGDMASAKRIAAPVLLSFSRRHIQMQTRIVSSPPRDVPCECRSQR